MCGLLHKKSTVDMYSLDLKIGEPNHNQDYIFKTNAVSIEDVEYLLIFDSRASNIRGIKPGFGEMLASALKVKQKKYLLLCRPWNLTVLFSVIGLLQKNKFQKPTLITNVGFVDCTPKKHEIINDMLAQADVCRAPFNLPLIELEEYVLSNGEKQMLYSLDYSSLIDWYTEQLAVALKKIFWLKSFTIEPDVTFERLRPKAFFAQLHEANNLINTIACKVPDVMQIEMKHLSRHNAHEVTYDGVHLTDRGHGFVFQQFMDSYALNLND